MCNYKYPDDKVQTCPYPDLYLNLTKESRDVTNNTNVKIQISELPIDQNQLCLFHSQDVEFKREHRSISRFEELIIILDILIKHDDYPEWELMDFKGFVFTSDPVQYFDEEEDKNFDFDAIELYNYKINHYVFFDHSRWLSKTIISHGTFNYHVSFENSIWYDSVSFRHNIFDMRVNFEGSEFRKDIGMSDNRFRSLMMMDCMIRAGNFLDVDVSNSSNFSKSTINNFTFERCTFGEESDSGDVYFQDSKLKNVKMKNLNILRRFSLDGALFNNTELIDLHLSDKIEVNLNDIKVKNGLIIKSSNPSKKMFSHRVLFDVDPNNIQGQIYFENTNVHYLEPRKNLKQLSKPNIGKIIIGDGCEKYRLKKEFVIQSNDFGRSLVEEIAQTFVYFFNSKNKDKDISIRFECEYENAHVLIRYFTDMNLAEDVFDDEISKIAPEFLKILKDPNYIFSEIKPLKEEETLDDTAENVGWFDVYRKALSTNIGLKSRIQNTSIWSSEETMRLLKTIPELSGSKININIEKLELHNTLRAEKLLIESGITIENQTNHGGSHQFADEINNYKGDKE